MRRHPDPGAAMSPAADSRTPIAAGIAEAIAEPCGSCHARPLGLCGALLPAELDQVAGVTERMRLHAHENLFRAGTLADTVYLVASGALKVYQLLRDGRRQIVAFPYPGDFLGLATGGVHAFTAEALTETVLCRFPLPVFNRLLADVPELRSALAERACDDLNLAQRQMTVLGRKSANERVASFLLQLHAHRSHNCSPLVQLPMTRADIADYLGLTTETVSRAFSHLRVAGAIRLHGAEKAEILKLAELERLASGGGSFGDMGR